MKKVRNKIIPSVFLLLIQNNKIFMLRRFNTGHQDGNYSLIAGHVEKNETPKQAIKREAKEEAGIEIDLDKLQLIHTVYRTMEERIDFFFTIDKWNGKPSNNEPEKCDNAAWFNFNVLPQNIAPYVKNALDNYFKNILYAEYKCLL
ncbi:MAG TPA: NUDIX domain-containing protein [Candidatus Sulfotelmatobacter sp.]|jgi:8-oxo-dGTP diphosphatase|nr:NUDIX domain-containing protein [Candidatus Sulfotelmatobacter sp.]